MSLDTATRDAIAELLTKTSLANEIRARGPGVAGFFIWPEPGALGRLESEIFGLVVQNWKGKWAPTDGAVQRRIRAMLWEAFRSDPLGELGERPRSSVDRFIEALPVPEKEFKILVEVRNVRMTESPLEFEGFRLGYATDLLSSDFARRVMAKNRKATGVWIEMNVSAPTEKLVPDVAFSRAEEALDLLATLDQRSTDTRGSMERIEVGTYYLLPELSEDGGAGYHNPLPFPDITIDRSYLRGDPNPRYTAPPFPWRELKPGSELAKAFHEAYRRFGHARRLSNDPEVAIPLAMSALEVLLVAGRKKGVPATARLIQASLLTDRPTMWPLELLEWFERRNAIVHEWERGPIRWDRSAASRAFWSLYTILDLVADAAIRGKHETRDSLHEALYEAGRAARARDLIEERIKELKTEYESSLTSQRKETIAEAIETWKDVQKQL